MNNQELQKLKVLHTEPVASSEPEIITWMTNSFYVSGVMSGVYNFSPHYNYITQSFIEQDYIDGL